MALQDDALRLAELDKKIDQAISEEGKFEELRRALPEYVGLRENLQRKTLDEAWLSIEDARAREVLRKISSGEGLEADNVVRVLGKAKGYSDLAVFGELDDATIEAWADLDFWNLPYEYARGLAESRPLISQCNASPTVKRLVGEARRCYALQQYDAATTMCRALLEAAVRDICERLELIRRSSKSHRDKWEHLLGKVARAEEPLKKKLKRLYGDLCKVVHAEEEACPLKALNAFHETLSVLEELYERHADNLRIK